MKKLLEAFKTWLHGKPEIIVLEKPIVYKETVWLERSRIRRGSRKTKNRNGRK